MDGVGQPSVQFVKKALIILNSKQVLEQAKFYTVKNVKDLLNHQLYFSTKVFLKILSWMQLGKLYKKLTCY